MNYVTLMIPAPSRRQAVWGALAFLALVAAYAMWYAYQVSKMPVVIEPIESRVQDMPDMSAYLYFSGMETMTDKPGLFTYVLDTKTGQSQRVSGFEGDHSFSIVDHRHALMVGQNWNLSGATDDPDYWAPMWSDFGDSMQGLLAAKSGWNEVDLVAHPNGRHIAYAQQPVRVNEEETRSLDSWELVVAVPEDDSVVVIPGAIAPQWVGAGAGLVYLKADGVYYRDFDSGAPEVLLFDGYEGLTRNADLAASPDGRFITVTIPGLGLIEVLEVLTFEAGGAVTSYLHTDITRPSLHPVFDREHELFATTYFTEGYPTVEVRGVSDATVLHTIPLPNFGQAFFALNDWGSLRLVEGEVLSVSPTGDDEHSH